MLATHSVKTLALKSKQKNIKSNIIANLDRRYICSKNIKLRRVLWEVSTTQNNNDSLYLKSDELPDITDRNLRCELFTHNNHVLHICSIDSMGVLYEINKRGLEKNFRTNRIAMVSKDSLFSLKDKNELLLAQKGCVFTFPFVSVNKEKVPFCSIKTEFEFVHMQMMINKASLTNGLVSTCTLSISKLSLFINQIENRVGENVSFALGIDSISQYNGSTYRKNARYSDTDSMLADAKINILLKVEKTTNSRLLEVIQEMNVEKMFGGGIVHLKSIISNVVPSCVFIVDATDQIELKDKEDALDDAFEKSKSGYMVSQIGHAFLEHPQYRDYRSKIIEHVWSEPIYTLTEQTGYSNKAWWKTIYNNEFVLARGVNNEH